MERLSDGVALGSVEYLGKVKAWAKGCSRDIEGRRKLRDRLGYDEVVQHVEAVTGARADEMNERGGCVKPLVMWAARQYAGLTLREIGERMGGMDYGAVSVAIRRFEARAAKNAELKKLMRRVKERVSTV